MTVDERRLQATIRTKIRINEAMLQYRKMTPKDQEKAQANIRSLRAAIK